MSSLLNITKKQSPSQITYFPGFYLFMNCVNWANPTALQFLSQLYLENSEEMLNHDYAAIAVMGEIN